MRADKDCDGARPRRLGGFCSGMDDCRNKNAMNEAYVTSARDGF